MTTNRSSHTPAAGTSARPAPVGHPAGLHAAGGRATERRSTGRHTAPAPVPATAPSGTAGRREQALSAVGALRTDRLAPTSLDELNAAAGLLVRVDRKYLVPTTTAQELVDTLAERARVLEISGSRRFSYASTYFDTAELTAYSQAAHKRRRRFKVRTRTYLDSGLAYLEVKTRGARGTTVKRRTAYRLKDAERLTGEAKAFVAACLADSQTLPAAEAAILADRLEPVLGNRYERTTLHLPEDGARLTIDAGLTWVGYTPDGAADPRTSRSAGSFAVVETKSPGGAGPADRALWAAGHRPARISKYATGLALLRPELAANRWHRVLSHELAPAGGSPEGRRRADDATRAWLERTAAAARAA